MTRFARAKGSKASNERVPEEPTPWHVMKQEVEFANSSKKDNAQHKTKSAGELLKEKDDPYYPTTTNNVNLDWAEFETENKQNLKKEKTECPKNPEKKKSKKNNQPAPSNEVQKNDATPENSEDTLKSTEKILKRKSTEATTTEECGDKFTATAEVTESSLPIKKKKKNKKKKEISSTSKTPEAPNSEDHNVTNVDSKKPNDIPEKVEDGVYKKLSKRQKRNRKNKLKPAANDEAAKDKPEDQSTPGAFNTDGNEWGNDVKFGNAKDITKNNESISNSDDKFQNNHPNPLGYDSKKFDNKFNNKNNIKVKKRKPPKIRDDKEHKRRKPNPGTNKVIINGMEVEIVMYDGFPIKKDDAERLKDLRKQMVMKGIPKSEIDAAMKLERRKAEKALTRLKKHVCFHCRKAGHNLSDCPELGREESATGICFKCGSTEHTHFECKVNKKEEFRFATCFICREQGHIAKQCPDNPKGLYPDGGSCNVCGDVTHLKKDCPDLVATKEENTLTLGTIAETQLESLEDDGKIKKSDDDSKKMKSKIVKF